MLVEEAGARLNNSGACSVTIGKDCFFMKSHPETLLEVRQSRCSPPRKLPHPLLLPSPLSCKRTSPLLAGW